MAEIPPSSSFTSVSSGKHSECLLVVLPQGRHFHTFLSTGLLKAQLSSVLLIEDALIFARQPRVIALHCKARNKHSDPSIQPEWEWRCSLISFNSNLSD